VTQGKIEETKINFFDPSKYEEEEKMFERAEEQQIIQAQLDPFEWKQEVDMVNRDLAELVKEIELAKDRGGDLSVEMEEYRRHMDLIVDCCREIRSTSSHDVRKVFQLVGETLTT